MSDHKWSSYDLRSRSDEHAGPGPRHACEPGSGAGGLARRSQDALRQKAIMSESTQKAWAGLPTNPETAIRLAKFG